jgi:shikimate kinase
VQQQDGHTSGEVLHSLPDQRSRPQAAVASPRDLQNLALVGFMGAGKTTVGRLVARQLGFTFVDTDEVIESRTRRRIAELFAERGEPAFRALEREVLEELLTQGRLVLATGGGLVCQPGNLELLKSRALVVCLWASVETIWERVRHQTHRPLLQVPDPRAEIVRLLAAREPYYRQADVLVNSGLRSLREVATHVTHHYLMASQKNRSK